MDADNIRYELRPFAVTFMGVFALEFFAMGIPGTDPLLLTGALRVLQASFIVWASCWFGNQATISGLSLPGMAEGLKRGLLWSGGFGLIAAGAGIVMSLAGYDPIGMIRVSLPEQTVLIVLFFLVAALVGPLAEELFFRGVIYGFIRRFGIFAAVSGSSVVFILAHSLTGIALTHVVGALVFAIAYEYEKNIMVPITIHVLGNFTLFTIAVL
jgi:uncharacterized protein